MIEVTKTLHLFNEDGEKVCDVDVVWPVHHEHYERPALFGLRYMANQIRAYAEKHMQPDELDIMDAKEARHAAE